MELLQPTPKQNKIVELWELIFFLKELFYDPIPLTTKARMWSRKKMRIWEQ
jgi:hypothetical protein